MVLHGDEARPVVEVGDVEGLGELPGVHGRCADVADLAGLDYVVEGLHGLFDGGLVVPAVDLIEVDVVSAETLQALVEFEEDFFAGEALAIGAVAHDSLSLVAMTVSSRLALALRKRPRNSSLEPVE